MSVSCQSYQNDTDSFLDTKLPCKIMQSCICMYRSERFFSKFLAKAMKLHRITPDIVPVPPPEIISVTYPSGAKVNLGNILSPDEVEEKPQVKWNAYHNALYTLCFFDPDVPSRNIPRLRQRHHWLVGNIPYNVINAGETLSEYLGAQPVKDTGLHRYIFLVYKQNAKIAFRKMSMVRGGFSVERFVKEHDLGEPVAGNFYQAEWGNFVCNPIDNYLS